MVNHACLDLVADISVGEGLACTALTSAGGMGALVGKKRGEVIGLGSKAYDKDTKH